MEFVDVQMLSVYGFVFYESFADDFLCGDVITEIPLADSGSLTTGPSADGQIGYEINRLPKANWRICTLQFHIY